MSYITASKLGVSAGLGSQLTTYYGLINVAEKTNKKIAFSKEMLDNTLKLLAKNQEIKVHKLLKLDYEILPNDFFNDFVKKQINYNIPFDKSVFELETNENYDFIGRFDLYHYWYDIKNKIESLQFQDNVYEEALININNIKNKFGNRELVSIHIRLGDYLWPQHSFCFLDSKYYTQAIVDNFKKNSDYIFVVFSDDYEAVKNFIVGPNVYVIKPTLNNNLEITSDYVDLCMMSLCNHNIISNSSFSCQAAILNKNKNKKVICPKNYLKNNHPSSWINGKYYLPDWIIIENDC